MRSRVRPFGVVFASYPTGSNSGRAAEAGCTTASATSPRTAVGTFSGSIRNNVPMGSVLETERLLVRPYTLDDLDELIEIRAPTRTFTATWVGPNVRILRLSQSGSAFT